ncbi:hypothetical protein [Methylobacter sp. S3L5C]|uniref:hypothetical protein n=1 Tax=Methylobacter sp. S3L5C TaxID=2839024 RepID=UPI001FAC7BA8|nr:hypothetical protein [Methylobacter sp. S3L5C]UOA08346.1 hypothetical protein KKZ03_19420 [Methylobacter sp. S3L5C]
MMIKKIGLVIWDCWAVIGFLMITAIYVLFGVLTVVDRVVSELQRFSNLLLEAILRIEQ